MMRYKANVSFAGEIGMSKGEERELRDSAALAELIRCGYVTVCKEETSAYKEEKRDTDGKTQRDRPRKRKAGGEDRL